MKCLRKFVLFSLLLSLMISFAAIAQDKVFKETELNDAATKEGFSFKDPVNCVRHKETGKCIVVRGFRPELNDQPESPTKQLASLSVMITFETNSAELTSRAKHALDIIGRNIKEMSDSEFVIEGHADLRGSYELNQRLSTARAESVMGYLANKHGVDRNKLSAIGKSYTELFDKTNPIAPENRRVTFIRIKND